MGVELQCLPSQRLRVRPLVRALLLGVGGGLPNVKSEDGGEAMMIVGSVRFGVRESPEIVFTRHEAAKQRKARMVKDTTCKELVAAQCRGRDLVLQRLLLVPKREVEERQAVCLGGDGQRETWKEMRTLRGGACRGICSGN